MVVAKEKLMEAYSFRGMVGREGGVDTVPSRYVAEGGFGGC